MPASATRTGTTFGWAPILRCCVNEDRKRARKIARRSIAFLIGAYGPYYRQSIANQGYADIAQEFNEAWQRGDTEEMAAALPDDLLDTVAAAGTPEEVRETVERFAAIDGVDGVRIGFFGEQSIDNQYKTMTSLVSE